MIPKFSGLKQLLIEFRILLYSNLSWAQIGRSATDQLG